MFINFNFIIKICGSKYYNNQYQFIFVINDPVDIIKFKLNFDFKKHIIIINHYIIMKI